MKKLHTTPIGNHKLLTDVEQKVNIIRFNIDGYQEVIELYYEMDFYKDGQLVDLTKTPKPWTISNNEKMFVRDENFNPVPNPDYIPAGDGMPDNSLDAYLRKPAFDYVMYLMMVIKVDLATIMTMYILEEAQDGRFD